MDASGAGLAQGKKILLCVTGGIAAYKVVEVARGLADVGADVRVAMTPSARRFVGAQTFAAVSGNPVTTDIFGDGADVPHVELARGAALAVVAPATANALARIALGFADDVVSATLLMVTCPVLVAPAMHTEMWRHPATARHVAELRARGAVIVGPADGALLSGDVGPGRMVEPEDIVDAVLRVLARSRDLAGRTVVVTAGGTREPMDAVRFIGNRSSGLMGFAIAREAMTRGAKVTLIAAHTDEPPPRGLDLVRVETAEEMREAVLQAAPRADVIFKAAAVADFKPAEPLATKLKKAGGAPRVTLVPTPDILSELGRSSHMRKPGSVLVGFAAETDSDPGELAKVAQDKRTSKGADLVVANDVGSADSGFGARATRAVVAGADGVADLGLTSKEALAEALMDTVVRLLSERR